MVRSSSTLGDVWVPSSEVRLTPIATMVLGIVAMIFSSCAHASTRNVATTQQSPQPAPLEYCELANHPENYDGQTVRVSATLYWMMHGYKFMDRACSGDEKETAVLLSREHQLKMAKEMGMDEYNPGSFPKIVATGRFKRVMPNRKSDTVADNSYPIFEMENVERVVEVTNPKPHEPL